MTANTHHTKLKGDIVVAAVIFDLTKKGYIVSEPMSENAPYDLICDTGVDSFVYKLSTEKMVVFLTKLVGQIRKVFM